MVTMVFCDKRGSLSMRRILRENGLSLVLFGLFVLFFVGQSIAGYLHYNEGQEEHGQASISYGAYLTTGSFLEATMENWESEFLQMSAYVLFTAFLFQKGSAESKSLDEADVADEEPYQLTPDAP